ncbi:hypothetical protein EU803_06960 [Loktanella sp. IMCC34160]|uniref:thermonuclease family protein n=1 Tax=Loktanella sp. IMCC34160 TaxID=2510646 RepID=UPI00101E1F68|nr:thermonuclease family protein [Loktanella sp. IMCC34160]RYG92174.1 hypothetical protein EU803_06960 [Loktanella sp. IMCC34160]
MEAVVLIFLGGILVLIFAPRRRSRKSRPQAVLRPEVRRRPPPPVRRQFDRETSVPVAEPKVLRGRAWVVDGDTIVIQKTQIRLFGIDAPEMNHPYGRKAKWALHALCKGQMVEARLTEVDGFGRTVARCHLEDGRDLSAEMVKAGMAIDWPKFSGGEYGCLEQPDARKKLWLADARQKGRMYVWKKFEARQAERRKDC